MRETTAERRDIRLSEVGQAIHARHIETPVSQAVVLRHDDAAPEARAKLERDGFDSAPVSRDGHIVGIFDRTPTHEARTVGEGMRTLWPGVLVTANTPLPELLGYLRDQDMMLILHGQDITGLITPADLNKPAARSYFYLQFAALEIALATFAAHRHPQQEDILPLLTDSGIENYQTVKADLDDKDMFIDVVSTLRLVDLIHVAGEDPEFRSFALQEHGGSWRRLRNLGKYRDQIMHPGRRLHATVSDLIKISERIRTLTITAEALLP